ncbi:lactonase family protein [Sporolactobacillus shoreae]|uniref:Lactonase family protein n=1 Tax=Sporolactobacillus shoreae TaxID=1465501 RepID=A0A4Z0GNN2_9BACL|nr:lactonase family protein [Sporolactobacillus shoreae]TGA97806.1 lactonase family protein [Sporolactobacillus shoreae]
MSQFQGFIGTYTKGESRGIYAFTLDTVKKTLSLDGLAAELGNPTYLVISGDNRRLYSVIKKGSQGGVAAYSIDQAGHLKNLGVCVSEGASPCYVSTDRGNRTVVSANYHKGSVDVYPITDSGIVEASDTDWHKGSGSDPERQEGPHVHFVDFSPDERFIASVDLGTDQLTVYREEDGRLVAQSVLDFTPGTGPRHLAFHPSAPYAYVMSELSNEIIALHFDHQSGQFSTIQTISALPSDFQDHSQGAAIKITSDGQYVYASNRGADSIAVFRVDSESGKLDLVEHVSTRGNWPRDFELDPTEHFLIAANQNSGDLFLYERDVETGRLSPLESSISVPDPVCVKFLHASKP